MVERLDGGVEPVLCCPLSLPDSAAHNINAHKHFHQNAVLRTTLARPLK
jgi:hypothetical protein